MAEIFNTVMRGYKNEEVTAYIADMSEHMQMLQNDLDRKDVELDRLNRELQESKTVVQQPDEEQIEALRMQIREELENELRAEYDVKLAEKEAELKEQAAQRQEVSELERKAKEYDECKEALAELMIQARRNADDIVEKAQAKAQMLRAKSELEFSQLRTSFTVLQQNIGNIRSQLQENMDIITDQFVCFEQKVSEIETEVEKTIGEACGSAIEE